MNMVSCYRSPIGFLLLSADEYGLTGLQFADKPIFPQREQPEAPAIHAAMRWLDIYFSGKVPDFTPPLHPTGTPFQMEVWEILHAIPYGRTVTYGEIANRIAARRGLPKMSAQAVGGAVGRNKIGIIIPCHRVIGTDRRLTGYSAGLDKKIKLLQLEGIKFELMEPR